MRCTPGRGDKTSFWHDNWSGLGRLKQALPVLFSFAEDQQCSVQSQRSDGSWNLKLLNPLSVTTERQHEILMTELLNQQHAAHNHDSRLLVTTDKPAKTRDFYRLFSDSGMRWTPAKWIWHSVIPHGHKIFLWLAFRRRLNTKVNKKWCTDSGCDHCAAIESFQHIALHCRQASWVWDKLKITQFAACSNDLVNFMELGIDGNDPKTQPVLMAACFLELWHAKNYRIFNNRCITKQILFDNIAKTLDLWATRSTKLAPALTAWKQKFLPPPASTSSL
uniref:Uncharacterized protein n=1 Tax=Avena sativa TaxID=4498 RepID=A0ACD5X8W9_AVESA